MTISVGSRPKNTGEADQKKIRSRPEADQKMKKKQTRSMTRIGILCQPKHDNEITIVNDFK